MLKYFYLHLSKILFFLLVLGFIIAFAPYGLNDADDGYILSLSWRIFNGEIPYLDFLWVRPPLSPYFHSISLFLFPSEYVFLIERVLFYLTIALSSVCLTKVLQCTFKNSINSIPTYVIASLGFVFSVHFFPAMPWHTTDGLLFASIGSYFLIRKGFIHISIAAFMFFLSALCKQSFYAIPILGILVIYGLYGAKKSIFYFINLLFFISVFIGILYFNDILFPFWEQTTQSLSFNDLLSTGVLSYFDFSILYFLLPISMWIILKLFPNNSRVRKSIPLIPFIFIALLLLKPISQYIYSIYLGKIQDVNDYYNHFSEVIFILSLVYWVCFIPHLKSRLIFGFILCISWSASLSWGYPTPALCSLPIIIGFLLLSQKLISKVNLKKLAYFSLFLGIINSIVGYYKPYSNPQRPELNYSLSDVFPKLSGIKVSENTFEKYNEFNYLFSKYPYFKTLPGFPMSNYLTNTHSPLKMDWVFNAEIPTGNKQLLKENKTKFVYLVEKQPHIIRVSNEGDKFVSNYTYQIIQNMKLIESGMYFDIYTIP